MIIKQYEYYHEPSEITSDTIGKKSNPIDKSFLNNISKEQLLKGIELTAPCNEIRINATPGVIFYINGEEVIIGEAGIYNILYEEKVSIIAIQVSEKTNFENVDYIVITLLAEDNTTFTATTTATTPTDTDTEQKSEEQVVNNHDSSKKKEDNN